MEAEPDTPPPAYRPLSGTEYSWYRAVPTGTGITVLALLLSRPLPLPIVENALRKLQNSHPVLASALSPTSLVQLFPCRLLLAGPRRPPGPDHLPPFHSLLEHELNLNPWAAAPPPVGNFFATAYDEAGDGGRWALALRFHTAVCDRTSAVAILKELLAAVAAAAEGGEADATSEEKGEVKLGIEEMIKREDAWKPFWARGRDLVGYSINGLRAAGLGFEETGTERSSEMVRMVLGAAETARLLHACNAKGIKLCAALAAAGLIAVYSSKHLENNEPETYSMVTLVDCRKFLEPPLDDHDVGFYHSAIMNMHTLQGGEGLWEVATRCHKAYSDAKSNKKHLTDIGELNFLMCKAIDNPHLTPASSLRTAVISVFEEPVLYESTELHKKLGVEDYVGCASVHGVGPSIAIFDTIRDGQLDCACVYPSPLHSRKQIAGLVECMKKLIIEGSYDVDDAEEMA